jgi:hypothetical protein
MKRTIAIFADADAFRIARIDRAGESTVVEVPVASDMSPESRAAVLGEALQAGGFAGAHAALLLPSTQCLCATISMAGLPARQRGQAMLYRFEEKLPVAAEDIAADFIFGDATTLAVGVERRVLEPLVDVVRQSGVRLRAVCPMALLALQEWGETRNIEAGDQWFCWPGASGPLELVRLADRRPVAWYVTSDDATDVAMHMRAAGGAQTIIAVGLPAEFLERLKSAGLAVESVEPTDAHRAAIDASKMVLAGRRLPWVDLANAGRAGSQGGGGFAAGVAGRVALAAVVVFVVCLVCALFVRASRYERLARGYESERQQMFRRLFPDAPIPPDVRSRLASEARAVTGDGSSSRPDADGLLVLRDVLTFLPTDTRFRVSELRLEGHAFTLEGDVPTHGDADAIAGALRRRDGFDVQPPRTEQRGAAVGFTINGTAGKPSSKQGGAVAALDREASR